MRFFLGTRVSAVVLLSYLVVACASSDDASEMSGSPAARGSGPSSGSNVDGGGVSAGKGGGAGEAPPPPERELESSYGAPVATGSFVWIANPESGRVAYIDAASLHVSLLDAGNGPTFVTAVPSPAGDTALVLNVLSKDATLMIKTAAGLATKRFSVPTGGNAWAVSSDGRWAIAWTDAARAVSKSSADGFQDLTVIDLASGTSTALSVGYRPVAIGYDKAATRAFAITQDGISVIDLAVGLVTKNVSLSASPPPLAGTGGTGGSAEGGSGGSDSAGSSGAAGQGDAGTSNGGSAGNGGTAGKGGSAGKGGTAGMAGKSGGSGSGGNATGGSSGKGGTGAAGAGAGTSAGFEAEGTRDVALTPDGAYALVRRDNARTLAIVSLEDETRIDIPLPAAATDLDLSADGTFAIAVIREKNLALRIPLPAAANDAGAVTTIDLGNVQAGSVSLAPKSSTALFYTNATPNPRLTILDAETPGALPRTLLLRAPVEAVFAADDGNHGIVLHASLNDETGKMAYPAAMSLVPLALSLPPKIVGLPSTPVSVAFLPTGDRALVAAGKSPQTAFRMHVVSFPSLAVLDVPLASEPIAAGVVPAAHRGFVAQKHPEGRITFIDFGTNEVRTITGFELAAQVVDGGAR